jgi:hypothetical protein
VDKEGKGIRLGIRAWIPQAWPALGSPSDEHTLPLRRLALPHSSLRRWLRQRLHDLEEMPETTILRDFSFQIYLGGLYL